MIPSEAKLNPKLFDLPSQLFINGLNNMFIMSILKETDMIWAIKSWEGEDVEQKPTRNGYGSPS